MQSSLEYKVHYADTDAYGVVWHGSYLRWLEAGRVEALLNNGIRIDKLANEQGIVLPVVEMNVKYKHSAKLMDEIIVKSELKEITKAYVIFHQEILIKETGKTSVCAEFKVVALDKTGRIMRNIPEIIKYGKN